MEDNIKCLDEKIDEIRNSCEQLFKNGIIRDRVERADFYNSLRKSEIYKYFDKVINGEVYE